MTDFECYRTMAWTSDSDECEADCGTVMGEGAYVEGSRGHYCSDRCRNEVEGNDGGCSDEREDFHADG